MDQDSQDKEQINARATAIAVSMAQLKGALLPILHAVQQEFGYVPAAAVPGIASTLNLSRAEVHGVISFYPLFRQYPVGRKTVFICAAESCQAMGGADLEAHAKQSLGIDYNETTADGAITLEPIFCLGNCACSPSIMIDKEIHSRVTPASFDALVLAGRGTE